MAYRSNTPSIRSFAQDRAVICGCGRGSHCRCPKELLDRPKYVHINLTMMVYVILSFFWGSKLVIISEYFQVALL